MADIHMMCVDNLICWQVRDPDPERERMLRAAMAEHGWVVPIVIDATGLVLLGQERVDAAKTVGMEQCPCIFREFLLSPEQDTAVVAANRLLAQLPWDAEAISSAETLLYEAGILAEGAVI